jgi:tetratricopeptide (TPR) repeat protein
VRLNPKLDRAWYGMGLAYAALGQHADAAQALQQAATLQPMNPHAWYNLGMAYHQLHQPDKVKEVVKHLHRFDPKMTRQLIRDAERTDLAHLVKDLRV